MLDDMEDEHLIEKSDVSEKGGEKKPLKFGCMKGLVLYIADDFDAPLEDFEEYMLRRCGRTSPFLPPIPHSKNME